MRGPAAAAVRGPDAVLTRGRVRGPAGPYRVITVCLGNICRSPMAAAVLRQRLARAGLSDAVEVTSAGTGGWHVGDVADRRARAALRAAGYDEAHTAQQFDPAWFDDLDLILAMDADNVRTLRRMAPDEPTRGRIRLLRSFDPTAGPDAEVPDPYYGGDAGFVEALAMIERACAGVVAHIVASAG